MTSTIDLPEADERIPGPVVLWQWMLDRKWPLAGLAGVGSLVIWELLGTWHLLPDYILSPAAIVQSIIALTADGTVPTQVLASLGPWGTGFLIGTSTGVLLGLLSGTSRVAGELIDPGVAFAYPLPKIALMPVIVIWLGFGDPARILIIALGCFFPSYINSASGTRLVDAAYLQIAANVEAGRARTFFTVVLPAALPRVLTGVRISLALSFVVLYASEIVVDPSGIGGGLIGAGYDNARYDMMYAGLAILAVLGFTADAVLGRVAKAVIRGQSVDVLGGR